MKRIIQILLCVLVLSFAPSTASAQSHAPDGSPNAANAGGIQISPIKHLRKGVDAWPLIANPSSPAERRVNEFLLAENLRLEQNLRDCDADMMEQLKQMEVRNPRDAVSGDWSRKVRVTMSGPRFLSLVADDSVYCGGAHPSSDQMAQVFDMTTGYLVDWDELLSASAGASSENDTVLDGTSVDALVLPGLQKMDFFVHHGDCKDATLKPKSFLIWPDARYGTLVAAPFSLPHAIQGCAKEIGLTMDQARILGFDESLLSAIKQAHDQNSARTKR
jgi:hypothetical protein